MIRSVLASSRGLGSALASVGGGGVPPYLAGGAPMPRAVYAPMLAGSLAESYLRIAGTGGNANLDPAVVGSGVAPTHAPGTGWGHTGTQWLNTGIVPADGWAAIVRFSGVTNEGFLAGSLSGGDSRFYLRPNGSAGATYGYGPFVSIAPAFTTGTIAIAANTAYRNGVADGALGSITATNSHGIYIGTINVSGSTNIIVVGNIQYIVIWDTSTDHATWMPAVSAAVMAL